MGCSAYVRDKVPLADVCICGGELSCDCYSEFCEVVDPDWIERGLDAYDYLNVTRRDSTPEEWNLSVTDWRASCGVE
jgi:hypothetical protein